MERPAYELLRQGAEYIEEQARGGYPLRRGPAGRLRGCALGAIAIAAQGDAASARDSEDYRSASRRQYLQLLNTPRPATYPCPGRGRWPWQHHWTCEHATRLGNQIAHLNDRHGWSFERIADWLHAEHPDWLVPVLPDPAAEEAVETVEELIRASASAQR